MGRHLGPLKKPGLLRSLEAQAMESPSKSTAGAGWPWENHIPLLDPTMKKVSFFFCSSIWPFDRCFAGHEWQGVGSRRLWGPWTSLSQPQVILRLTWTPWCVSELWAVEGAHRPLRRCIWESEWSAAVGECTYTPKGLRQQATNAGAGTLLSDCHQHNRALQEATDKFHSLSTALQTLCLVTLVFKPCNQRHSSCSGTPAEDHLVPVSTDLVPCVLSGKWPEHTSLSFSLWWRTLFGPTDQKCCL